MADIVVKGRPFYRLDPTLAKVLEQLFPEDVQKLHQRQFNLGQGNQPPVTQRKPEFSVGKFGRLGRAVLKLVTPAGAEYFYQFAPEQAQATFTKMGFPVPEQFLNAYAEAWGRQPSEVWREATPEDNLMRGHMRRDLHAATPTPVRVEKVEQ